MPNEGRLQTCKGRRAGVNPAQHRMTDARTSRYAETYARWQRNLEVSAVRCVRRACALKLPVIPGRQREF